MLAMAEVRNDGAMTVDRFPDMDAYGLVDVPGSAVAVGPVRAAKKVLERTTTDLARHVTYALAVRAIDGTGAAVCLNGDPMADDRDRVVEQFVAASVEWSTTTGFRATHGMGLDASLIDPLLTTPPVTVSEATAASAVGALGSPDGPIVIASPQPEPEVESRLAARGLESSTASLEDALAMDGATVFVRCRTGDLDHGSLDGIAASRIVSLTPSATTARGLAFARRSGCVVVPDFISAGGWAHACATGADADDIAATAEALAGSLAGSGVDSFVAAAELAETNLRTRTADLPFGRPLAP